MNLAEAGRAAYREIRGNKTRSVLSFAAVSVGVASLVYTLAQTRGMRENLEKAISLIGPGRIEVEAKQNYVSRGLSPGLTAEDAAAIRAELPELYMVYPKVSRWRGIAFRYGKESQDLRVEGVSSEWSRRDWVYEQRGRFLNAWDNAKAARVCVLIEPGGWIKKPFWAKFWIQESPWEGFIARHDLLGRRIELAGRLFSVVGVLREPPMDKDPRWYSNRWNSPQVLIPVNAYHDLVSSQGLSRTGVDSIVIDTGSEKTLGSAKSRIESLLRRRHRGEEDFELKDLREEIQGELNESRKILLAMITLGAVALFAGGIGIMNVTLAAVFSRVREIGIRRALGASRADIMAQFVAEALFLGLAGGLAGLALGAAGVDYMSRHTERDMAQLAWIHGLAAMAVAAAVSAAFSLYPAYQASRLDPVEALRNE